MCIRLVILVAGLLVSGGLPERSEAQVSRADGAVLSSVLDAVSRDDWAAARAAATRAQDSTSGTIALWFQLADGVGSWNEYAAFLRDHDDWPRVPKIRGHAERKMPGGLPSRAVIDFFAGTPPVTGTGALRLAAAYEQAGDRGRADQAVLAAWRDLDLKPEELSTYRAQHARLVSGRVRERLDNMLWKGWTRNAGDLLPFLPPDLAALTRARIALIKQGKGVDGLIRAVPPHLASDPGLAYDRYNWRMKKGLRAEAAVLLLSRSGSVASLGRPDLWASRRLSLAHQAMREGRINEAYRLASQHQLTSGSRFNELEWFSGWLALRKMGDPRRALSHFQRFRSGVATPISLGRAGYWLGRTHEKLGDTRKAQQSYADAARFQTSFYGQLAAIEAGLPSDRALVANRSADWRRSSAARHPLMRAAQMFHYANKPGRVWQFLTHMAALPDQEQNLADISNAALDMGRHHVAVRLAKIAARKGQILMDAYYPVTNLAQYATSLPPELALSIARQESEFNIEAVSPAGARGLMQLMPATAQKVSRELGLRFSRARLTGDWQYNAQLGSHYLSGLLTRFGGAVALSAAGYNAGPHRVDRWIDQYGDPRRAQVDMIDWIETIPFAETRNYVMRVMEGLHVYRSRLSGSAVPLRLTTDLGL